VAVNLRTIFQVKAKYNFTNATKIDTASHKLSVLSFVQLHKHDGVAVG